MDSNTGSGAPQQTAAPKRERQRKWDVPSLAALQEDPLERARKMAEEIAMQLAAKNPSQTPATPTVIVREIDINDSRSRIILTKGATQQEIQRQSGASVITRGRYKPPGDTSNSTERPLYLHISSEKEEAVLKAVEIIEKYMQQGNNSNYAPHQQYNRPAINPQPNSYSAVPPTYATAPSYPSTTPYGASLHPNSDQPSKIFIGIDADPSFNLMYRLHGPDNSYLTHIQNETKVFVEIKGRGTGKDEDEPMHFSITASHANQAAAAKNLCESLLNSVWTAFQAHKAQMTQPPAAPSPQAPPGYPPGYATPGYQATPPPPPPGYPPGYVPPHINTPGYAHHPPHPHAAPYAHHPTYPAGYAPGYAHPHIHPHAQPSVPGYGSIPPPPAGPPPANLPPGYIVPPPVAPPPNPSSGRTSFSAVPPPPSYFKSGGDSDTAEKAKEESHEDDATPEVHIVPPPPMMPRLPSSVKADIPSTAAGILASSKSATSNPLDKVLQDQKHGDSTTPKRVIIPILSKGTPNSQDGGPKKSVRFSPHNEIFIIEARNTEPQSADGFKLVDYGEEDGDNDENQDHDAQEQERSRPGKRLFASSTPHTSESDPDARGKTSAHGLLSHYHQDTDEYDEDSTPSPKKRAAGPKPFWAAFNE